MDRKQLASKLANAHVTTDAAVSLVVMYTRAGGDYADEPIKLLEINDDTVPFGIVPVYFGRTREYPPVVIVEVTAQEYRAVQDGSLRLPDGWDNATPLGPAAQTIKRQLWSARGQCR